MIILNTEEIIELHTKLVDSTGGSHGIRDPGLLESAVMGCSQTFGGTEMYPTVIEKASRMAYSICKNHPFIDGNKRVAVTALLVILRMNDISLQYSQNELIILGLGIADGSIDYDEIVSWVNTHTAC
jgi:death-on-curing protein